MRIRRVSRMILVGVVISLLFVALGVTLLSLSVETLDEVAERMGVAESPFWTPPFPDYEIPGLEGNVQANLATGVAFTLVVLGITLVVGRALSSSRKA